VLTAACFLGVLDRIDYTVSDAFYLHEEATDGVITVVGIDEYSIEELGQMPWSRSVYAEAINYLNSDPEHKPAVIAIDVLFTGAGTDPEADAELAAACEAAGNVVVAAAGTFGSDIVEDGDSFYVDSRALIHWDEPYAALKSSAYIGCINAMCDTDGMLRHVMFSVDTPSGEVVKTMPRQVYELYADFIGEEYNTPELTDGFFYLPYIAKRGAYNEGISIADLINGDVDPEEFEDRIVLIGPYTAGLQDEYRTSIDHADTMYGIEVQANQIDAYRKGFFPKEVGTYAQMAIVFVVSAIALYFLLDCSVKHAIAIWIAICAAYIGACIGLYKAGHILHVSWVPIAVTVLFIASVAVNYIRASAEKRKVTETFGKYVDPAVLNQLLKTDEASLALGGKTFDIAVLFVDIRGFTTMSESLPAETVVEILNTYLTLTTECIMRYHGTLDKFVGDCTMAFWNAPLPQEDPIYLACCAAMDMVERAKTLGEELEAKYGRSVGFGVGVHYGPAVVGNIGAAKRMDYTAIGDTVNTSSRLESNAPAGTVYISRVVADALGDRAKTTSLGGTIKLKGKTEGFEVLKLDELKM